MPARKRLKTYPATPQRTCHQRLPHSHPQSEVFLGRSSAGVSGQANQEAPPANQDRGSRKRPRCNSNSNTTVSAPTTSNSTRPSSAVSSKRKRDSTTDSVKSPSFEDLEDEVSKKICAETPEGTFTFKYSVGEQLGSGGYGSVYEGTRKSDGEQVAIKYILKRRAPKYITMPDGKKLPLEVALMTLVSQPEACPNIVQLLDWYDCGKFFILVLERPSLYIDLFDACLMITGYILAEDVVQKLMRQLVHALIHCRDHGVFHRDVKQENILVNLDDWTLKLIDFGCGDLLKEDYRGLCGTERFIPPEMFQHRRYKAAPTTTWSLGVLLFELVSGNVAFHNSEETVSHQPEFPEHLSEACKDLISWCLRKEPEERPTLEGILTHEWMTTNRS
ncbi:serine/threonine-protein kinase pim-1-like [Engraulis encrasicolus]|uniref:serine/threonine-protein kinase pim-1-like n=1 Tax=Engraulis encrasicolus TaxID=184585 RepID=UPI002FD2D84D